MNESSEKDFVQEIREVLRNQLSDFEQTKKRSQREAQVVMGEGAKKWSELKAFLKSQVEEINEAFSDPLLSYSDGGDGNEFTLRHELEDRTVRVAFAPASAHISLQSNSMKGEFRPRVVGDVLDYGWEIISPSYPRSSLRTPRGQHEKPRMAIPMKQMSEIVIRCLVECASPTDDTDLKK